MKLLELLRKSTDYLKGKGVENPRLEAEILLCEALGCRRIDLYAEFEKLVTEEEKEKLRGFLRRRSDGEPIQYITGLSQFRFLELKTEDGVFIPRPETELIVKIALEILKSRESGVEGREESNCRTADKDHTNGSSEEHGDEESQNHIKTQTPKHLSTDLLILEIGTGTGAIALSLAKEGGYKAEAVDINPKAVSLARKNAVMLSLGDLVDIKQANLYGASEDKKYDLIISNPPYVSEKGMKELPPEVQREPVEALSAGKEGLDAIVKILSGAKEHLTDKGTVLMEMAPTHSKEALKVAVEM